LRAIAAVVLAAVFVCGPGLAASRPGNELPMYGGLPKTPAMIVADEEFIKANEKLGHTRVQGSDIAVVLGWRYYDKNDYATAIKRFNQAWLLDPDNGDAFEGFAAVVNARDKDSKNAEEFFKQALAKSRHRPVVMSDYGLFLLRQNRIAEAIPILEQAVTIPDQSPDAQALLAMAYEVMRNPAACEAAAKVTDNAFPQYRDSARKIPRSALCRAAQ
jgi:Tfp pilus assembly protein PilF